MEHGHKGAYPVTRAKLERFFGLAFEDLIAVPEMKNAAAQVDDGAGVPPTTAKSPQETYHE
jgi:hypothetical protein